MTRSPFPHAGGAFRTPGRRNGAPFTCSPEGADAMSTTIKKAPAIGATWFTLSRHDDPDPEPDPKPDPDPDPEPDDPADPADPDPDPDDDPDPEGLGDAGKKALDRMKAERAAAKKEAATAKKAAVEERRKGAALAKKVAEFEDRDRTELEKAEAKAKRSDDLATKAVTRTVAAEVKAAAAGKFADVSDATDALLRDPGKYVDSDGEVDVDAIEADLADLLERKPHWAVAEPAAETEPAKKPKPPKPDLGQGPRGPVPPASFLDAPKEQVAAELAKYGYRQRSQ